MNFAERRMDRWYSSFRAAEPWGPTRLAYIRRCTKQGSSPIGSSVPRLVLSTPASSQATSLRIASPHWTSSGRGWSAPTHGHSYPLGPCFPKCGRTGRYLSVASLHFFKPNLPAFWGAHIPLGVDGAGFYSTAPLRETLAEFMDCSIINKQTPRLTVGAANVKTSMMHYFDSRQSEITIAQIMASGALPPAFPAVYTNGEFYWDGGILSNTPIEVIFDDSPRRNSLIFGVQLWNPKGPVPQSIWEVLNRRKEIQYSSRI